MDASTKSLPLQVAEKIITEIRSLKMVPGEKLPPLRQLAKSYHISYVSAQRALRILQERRLVDSRSGGGTYVANEVLVLGADEDLKLASTHEDEKKIGILLPSWAAASGGASVYEIIDGFTEICNKNNWIVELITNTQKDISSLALVKKIYQKNFDGLVWLTPLMMHKWILDELTHRISCLVVSERPFENMGINSVHMDYGNLAQKMVELFISRGHRNIVIFTGQYEGIWADSHTTVITEAIRKAAKATEISFNETCYCQTHPLPQREAGMIIREYFKEYHDRNAVVCLHNEHLKLIVEEVKKHNKYPNDACTIIDNCYQSNPFYVDQIEKVNVFRVRRPNRKTGVAIGNVFEQSWLKKDTLKTSELKAEIVLPGEMI